jgi:hypothetical protein
MGRAVDDSYHRAMADVFKQVRQAAVDVFGGRRVVVAGGMLAGMVPLLGELRAAGVERVLLLGGTVGTGPLPDGDDLDVELLDVDAAATGTEQFRAEERVFADPPAVVVATIRRFAGDRPLVLAPPFAGPQTFGPFPIYGARRPAWVALEDKTTGDRLLDAAEVARPPSSVVPMAERALRKAAARHDAGAGTVWAGDAREGFNGGAEFVRWVRDAESQRAAIEFFAAHCDVVRVAPFVDGVPCSIHGFVTHDAVAVFRPVELMTFRVDEPTGLRYAGAATYYDPPDSVRAYMRAAAARVGSCLRDWVDFRGPFTVDGIATGGAWVATECNPRSGAGLGFFRDLPQLLSGLAMRLVIEGRLLDYDVVELERVSLDIADKVRWGGAWTAVSTVHAVTTSTPIAGDEDGFRVVASDDEADAAITFGPNPAGGFVRFEPIPARTPTGPSLAPRAAAAFACADRELAAGIGPVRPALSPR